MRDLLRLRGLRPPTSQLRDEGSLEHSHQTRVPFPVKKDRKQRNPAEEKAILLDILRKTNNSSQTGTLSFIDQVDVDDSLKNIAKIYPSLAPIIEGTSKKTKYCGQCGVCWTCSKIKNEDHKFFYDLGRLLRRVSNKLKESFNDLFLFCLARSIKHSELMISAREQYLELKRALAEPGNALYRINAEINPRSLNFYLEALKFLIRSRSFLASTYVLRATIYGRNEQIEFNNVQDYLEITIDALTKLINQNPVKSFIEVEEALEDEEGEAFLVKEFSTVKANISRVLGKASKHYESVKREILSNLEKKLKSAKKEGKSHKMEINSTAVSSLGSTRAQGGEDVGKILYQYFNPERVVHAWNCDICSKVNYSQEDTLIEHSRPVMQCYCCGNQRDVVADLMRLKFLPSLYKLGRVGYSTKNLSRVGVEDRVLTKYFGLNRKLEKSGRKGLHLKNSEPKSSIGVNRHSLYFL